MKNEYYLCSSAVIEHFPDLKKSKPFKSGYSFENDEKYYVIETDSHDAIKKYYDSVIQPYNAKSNVSIDFWTREICNSQIDEAKRGCLTKCRQHGVFVAIENLWNLTKENNRAYAIFRMAEYYALNPIEFINKVGK
jgi:hypothetical protein